jgi:hypothetical protein
VILPIGNRDLFRDARQKKRRRNTAKRELADRRSVWLPIEIPQSSSDGKQERESLEREKENERAAQENPREQEIRAREVGEESGRATVGGVRPQKVIGARSETKSLLFEAVSSREMTERY